MEKRDGINFRIEMNLEIDWRIGMNQRTEFRTDENLRKEMNWKIKFNQRTIRNKRIKDKNELNHWDEFEDGDELKD